MSEQIKCDLTSITKFKLHTIVNAQGCTCIWNTLSMSDAKACPRCGSTEREMEEGGMCLCINCGQIQDDHELRHLEASKHYLSDGQISFTGGGPLGRAPLTDLLVPEPFFMAACTQA